MSTQSFTVVLDRLAADEDYDRIYEAGLDDTTPETRDGALLLRVDRDAENLDAAIVSVVADVQRAGFEVTAVEADDLVSLKTVAARLDRSYEGVRLLAAGKRGPGGFPAALSGDGWSLYSWAAVADWFAEHYGVGEQVGAYERTIAAADLLVRARLLLHGRDAEASELGGIMNIGHLPHLDADDD